MRFLILLALLLASATARAEDAGRYEVNDIAIDMPTDSPATARDAALSAAMRTAYTQLQERLAAEGETLPALDDKALARAVQDFEVNGEKVSGKRYIGTFTIRFRPAVVGGSSALAATPAVPDTTSAVIPVTVAFSTLAEWQTAETALRAAGGVRDIQITALRRNAVDVDLRYAGADITSDLAAQGLAASNDNGRWMVKVQR